MCVERDDTDLGAKRGDGAREQSEEWIGSAEYCQVEEGAGGDIYNAYTHA